MRKGTAFFLAVLLSLSTASAFAADQPVGKTDKKAAETRITRMKAAGTVTEISDTLLKIERTAKGKMEAMEFVLEKPVADVAVGDKVQVSYVTKEDRNVATKVIKSVVKKPIPKATIKAKPTGPPPVARPAVK